MSAQTSEIIIRLVDEMTGTARQMLAALDALGASARLFSAVIHPAYAAVFITTATTKD